MSKRIVIIDHFSQAPGETGNNRFIYLASVLVDAGYEVEIVTSDFSHIRKKTRNIPHEEINKLLYRYTMLHEAPYKKNICIKRLFSHALFGKKLYSYLSSLKAKPNALYMAVPSLSAAKAGLRFCNKNHIPAVVDIQDLWPEAFKLAFSFPIISDILFWPIKHSSEYIYKHADCIIAVSMTYLERAYAVRNEKAEHSHIIYLGTRLDIFDRAAANTDIQKNPDEIWITYIGTLGKSYDIHVVIDALAELKDHGFTNLVFKVIGDGPQQEKFQRYADQRGIRADFLGRMPYDNMVGFLVKSDIAVNPIVKGAAASIINKHGDYAAAGLPVINTQVCAEYQQLLEQYNCGINCDPDNIEQLANSIGTLVKNELLRKTMGQASRRMAQEHFDRAVTYVKMKELIKGLIQ